MDTVLIREQYKVVRVLEAGAEYAFAEAVDITQRETPMRLLNLYEGAQLPIYARIFSEMQDCDAFCEAFLREDSLIAVFCPCDGEPIDRVFYRGASWSWRDRLHYAEQVLHQALTLANLPPAVGCAALLSGNVRVDTAEKRVTLRFCVRPMEGMNARELALLASDQARKVLAPRLAQGDAEYAFCRRLERGEFASIVPLYAAWRRAAEQIAAEYEKLDKKNGLKRWLTFLWKAVRRRFRNKRR